MSLLYLVDDYIMDSNDRDELLGDNGPYDGLVVYDGTLSDMGKIIMFTGDEMDDYREILTPPLNSFFMCRLVQEHFGDRGSGQDCMFDFTDDELKLVEKAYPRMGFGVPLIFQAAAIGPCVAMRYPIDRYYHGNKEPQWVYTINPSALLLVAQKNVAYIDPKGDPRMLHTGELIDSKDPTPDNTVDAFKRAMRGI